MGALIGFALGLNLPEKKQEEMEAVQHRVLAHFPDLKNQVRVVGESRLYLWGRADFEDCIYTQPDGSVLALIGSPTGKTTLSMVGASLNSLQRVDEFSLPWDGRVVLLWVSADGKSWRMWNDWVGSIPVYHAVVGTGRLASTLEPVAVAGAGYNTGDLYLPALVSLLTNGHFISDWTLFKGMKTVPPDCFAEWDDTGYHNRSLSTVTISESRWETSWDSLVDEMYELSREAVSDVLQSHNSWILPLSAGLDSRLIAAVAADLRANVHTYAWGESNTTDVIFSREIAKRLGFSWKHIDLPGDFLVQYTPEWADLFGSAMHFHGMYQMAFLDGIRSEPKGAILSGFIGDVLSGSSLMQFDKGNVIYRKDWYKHWTTSEVKALLRIPVEVALEEIAAEVKKVSDSLKGSQYSRSLLFELWTRQRFFTSFQATLSDYWRGAATPFINRKYAQFCLSLPRVALEGRRLLGDVFRRYYGRLAVVPGTYADDPYIPTVRYLIKQRIAKRLPSALHIGPFAGFGQVPLRMDVESLQATGKSALWPLYDEWDHLNEWLDITQVEAAYQTVSHSAEDIRPLRKLQSVQTLAYRLMNSTI